jgi:hypothetical protein
LIWLNDLQWVGGRCIFELSGKPDENPEEGKMVGQKFTHKNQEWMIVEIKTHNDNFRTQLGWTHFAAIKRPSGKKIYCMKDFLSVAHAVTQSSMQKNWR